MIWSINLYLCGLSLVSCLPKPGDTILVSNEKSAKASELAQDLFHVKTFIPDSLKQNWLPAYQDFKAGHATILTH